MTTVVVVVAVTAAAAGLMFGLRGSRSRWLGDPPAPRRTINDNRGDRR